MEGTDGEARVPARRSRSESGAHDGRRDPAAFYAFPSTLHDILYGPRQRLSKYADGMQARPYTPDAADSTRAAAEASGTAAEPAAAAMPAVNGSAKPVDVPVDAAAEKSAAGEDASARAPRTGSEDDQQQQPPHEEAEAVQTAEANAEALETAADATSAEQRGEAEAAPVELPQLRATLEMVAFDPAQVATWMRQYRHCTAHVPAGVERFVAELQERAPRLGPPRLGGTSPTPSAAAAAAAGKKGKKGNLTSSAAGSPKLGAGSLADMPGRDAGGFGSSVAARSGASSAAAAAAKKSNALEALGDVWEGRQEMPISLAQGSLRRRGLFGEVEKKKIHHMVVSVLNKVTTDPEKFREVKNELLRLPIPEANAEQLTKIVDAFFNKAVREQHFSHSYADLIVALCKVPQGQHIVGDKTQSLEYRLRSALLKRCQAEFVQSIRAEGAEAGGSTAGPETDGVSSPLTSAIEGAQAVGGETEKERRDRMCGNVRFVCELFLREIVAAPVISVIIRICCLGSEFGEFVLPPAYTPTESQVDEVITAVNTVKDRYFAQSPEGRRVLPLLLGQLEYWVKHYSVSRCRFVLMSIVEDLRAMLPKDAAVPTAPPPMLATPQLTHRSPPTQSPPPPAPQPQPPSQAPPQAVESVEQAVLTAASTLSASASATAVVPAASSPLLSAVDATGQLSMSSTMVGGQPLPAPRSKQVGSVSLSDSAGSINGAAQAESPVTTSITRPLATLASRPLLQAVRPEAIAKLMAAFSAGQCAAAEVAEQLFEAYGNVLPAIGAWMDRCLSVVKEEKTRKQTGAMLIACAAHLTANTNASEQEVAETVAACREQLHEAALEALQRAVATKLYEDLHVFQFWAQLILSDHARVLYDEELLNEGLEMLVCTAPPAVRSYLVEVGKYMTQVLVAPEKLPWQPSAEPQNFVRYRPLLVLHSLVLAGGPNAAQALLDNLVGFSDVRQQSLELRLYHAFRTGSPAREVIFEQLRTSPRLTSRDSTLAAEVLSALLITELCSNAEALVEDSMDLMQLTVDGVNRAEREIAVVAEVYEVLRYTPRELTMSAAARVLRKFVYMHVLSDETMERADHFYGPDGDAAAAGAVADRPDGLHPRHPGGDDDLDDDGRTLLAPPSADYPRIMDRRGTEDTMLSASMSLRSTNGASPTNANGILHHLHGAGSVDGVPSSSASSFAEFRPRDGRPPRRDADSGRHSQRRMSHSSSSFAGPRGGDGGSKQLYRNTYKNRRRSQGEGGSEAQSSAGGSKDASPQQHSMGPGSPHVHYTSHHDGSRGQHGGDDSRYDRPHGGGRGGRGGSYEHSRGGGSRGNGRGGAPGRGGNGSSSGGGRGSGGRGGGGISRDDSRRPSDGAGRGGGGGSRYSTRPPNGKP